MFPLVALAGGLVLLFFATSAKASPPPVKGPADEVFKQLTGKAVGGVGLAIPLDEYQSDVNELSPDERTEFDAAVMACDSKKLAELAEKHKTSHPATAKTLLRLSTMGCKAQL